MSRVIDNEIENTSNELQQVLSSFTQKDINNIPFAGSWTAGQVAEHVLKSASGVLDVLNGPEKPADRNPEAHIKQLGELF